MNRKFIFSLGFIALLLVCILPLSVNASILNKNVKERNFVAFEKFKEAFEFFVEKGIENVEEEVDIENIKEKNTFRDFKVLAKTKKAFRFFANNGSKLIDEDEELTSNKKTFKELKIQLKKNIKFNVGLEKSLMETNIVNNEFVFKYFKNVLTTFIEEGPFVKDTVPIGHIYSLTKNVGKSVSLMEDFIVSFEQNNFEKLMDTGTSINEIDYERKNIFNKDDFRSFYEKFKKEDINSSNRNHKHKNIIDKMKEKIG